jgi:hypothetical protein
VARTLLVSDLHLGTRGGGDLLGRAGVLDALLAGLEGVDRLVLLGDTLELRAGRSLSVLEGARPLLERLGDRLGGRHVVLVPGNHDHALVGGWLERREAPLGLEQRCAPSEASFAAASVAAMLAPAAVEIAYPGIWIDDGVYAMHGHHLDVHMTVPTIERLAISVSGRLGLAGGRRWDDVRNVDDYEALIRPVYAWIDAAAQSGRPSEAVAGGRTVKAWNALRSGRGGSLRDRALSLAFPWIVWGANAAGLGPLRSEVTPAELRRAGLRAQSVVVERLAIGARHVIFGHTHRAGMFEDDEPAEWRTPNGTTLHNTGAWVFSAAFAAKPGRPYWPGTAVLVEDGSPPRLLRMLDGLSPEDLSAPG